MCTYYCCHVYICVCVYTNVPYSVFAKQDQNELPNTQPCFFFPAVNISEVTSETFEDTDPVL